MEYKNGGFKRHIPHPVVLIGGGGIGSHALPVLVQAGPARLTVVDDDVFKDVNRQLQLFPHARLGSPKADVLVEEARRLNPALDAQALYQRITASSSLDGVVVAGVDLMESRSAIFEAVLSCREQVKLYIDGRLSRANPGYAELFAIDPSDEQEIAAYKGWLFPDTTGPRASAPEGIAAHGPHALAALIGAVLSRWVIDGRHPWRVTFDAVALNIEKYFIDSQQGEAA